MGGSENRVTACCRAPPIRRVFKNRKKRVKYNMVERVPQVPLVKEGQEATQLLPAKQGQGQGDAQTTTGDSAGSGFFLPQAGGALSSTGNGAKGV